MSKIFSASQILLNAVSLMQQGVDPSAGGGVAAAIGSFFLRSGTGQIWLKTGAADAAWSQFKQSFNWISIADYGVVADGSADATAGIQQAINDCNSQGGGVVWVPPGTYAVTQLTMNGSAKVQLVGAGPSSILKWVWNAATAAGSLLTIYGAASQCRLRLLHFDGSSLTNPNAGRDNHLVRVGDGATAVTEVDIWQCQFGGMVASSGDGVHAVGTNANRVQRLRIADCMFDGCSRYGVGIEQGLNNTWVVNNYMTNCETEIAAVATSDVNSDAMIISGNQIVHTGAVRHALRMEGGSTTLITKLICAENTILAGFATLNRAQYSVVQGNVITSGAFASADSVFRIFGNVIDCAFVGNLIDRSTTTAGYVVSLEKSTSAPTGVRVGQNLLVNEASGGGFVQVVDCTLWSIGGNLCRNTNTAGASTTYAMEVQAVTVAITDCILGPGNQMTAAAGTYAGLVRLLANGANIQDISVVGNQGDQGDYGLIMEVGGGGGNFSSGQIMYAGNNFDSSVGDINRIGNTTPIRIGNNASTIGANLWSGAGTPEAAVTSRVSSMYLRTDGGQATAVYYKDNGTGNTGWLGIGGSMIPFGADSLGVGAGTVFFGPGYITLAPATEIQINITRPATIRNLRVQVATAGTGADTVTYTLRKNGVDTTVTCSLGNTSTGGASDLTHSFTVVAGDLLSLSAVKGAGVTTGQAQVCASAELC